MADLNQVYILLAAFALGLRHGTEWDHLAAIVDITATDIGLSLSGTGLIERTYCLSRAFWLSTCYGLGHSLIVIALGFLARSFATFFPSWFDALCTRIVGYSLICFALWVFYAVFRSLIYNDDPKLASRWMLVYNAFKRTTEFLQNNLVARSKDKDHKNAKDGAAPNIKTSSAISFAIGMLHGLGVETGTQIFVLSAVGASTNSSFAFTCAFLFAFVSGLITSNSIVALCSAFGLRQTRFFKPLYLVSGALAGVFSLCVGTCLATGEK